jgi:hypothetical protein
MLAESIIRIGRPIAKSNKLPNKERIRWLTDVSSENCKNYFQNVFVVELDEMGESFSRNTVGGSRNDGKKESFVVDPKRNVSFPILYPNGGNPLHAQGIYPLPCYLMYDPHIKAMKNQEDFQEVLLPRLKNTVCYQRLGIEAREKISKRVAKVLAEHINDFYSEEKQLGILMIFDHRLTEYERFDSEINNNDYLWIQESRLSQGKQLYLNGNIALKGIVQAKFEEAGSLGKMNDSVSTFTNEKTDKVVSIYNKTWLWLSPTWDMPKSIYWGKEDWTKGIKVDRESYEAFLYGAQFLKKIQVPISSSVLKEMFAPVANVEAKKHMRATSFEPIFGIPMVLPLLDGDSEQLYQKFHHILRKNQDMKDDDLQLELLAGMKESIVPNSSDDYRLTILYYSGDLSRGNMHIRATIEDVIPSAAFKIQEILKQLKREELPDIQQTFDLKKMPMYRTETLPALLANAYGPGYVWNALQSTLHRKPLTLERLKLATMKKLNELANKEEYWEMKQELVFYYGFIYFLGRYNENILQKEKGVKQLTDWQGMMDAYHKGNVKVEDLKSPEALGFVSGLLLKQFSNSYYQKTDKDYVKHRVMKFGNKLTPEMIWKNGVLRCEELAEQWDMGLAGNFRSVLSQVLLGFIEADKNKWFVSEKETFMTAFWSGNLIYKKEENA